VEPVDSDLLVTLLFLKLLNKRSIDDRISPAAKSPQARASQPPPPVQFHLSSPVTTCHQRFTTCHYLSLPVITCHHLPPPLITCLLLPPPATTCHHLPPPLITCITYSGASSGSLGCHELVCLSQGGWRGLDGFGGLDSLDSLDSLDDLDGGLPLDKPPVAVIQQHQKITPTDRGEGRRCAAPKPVALWLLGVGFDRGFLATFRSSFCTRTTRACAPPWPQNDNGC